LRPTAFPNASQFLTEGDVHLSRDAQGTITPTAVEPGGLAPTIPLVVLVDEGSASSAEIVTGALQDAGRATVVGRPTFGTGTVVSEVPLSDGSALRIGVIEWLTPKGRSIWRVGLTPDSPCPCPRGGAVVPEDLAGVNRRRCVRGCPATAPDLLGKAIEVAAGGCRGARPRAPVEPVRTDAQPLVPCGAVRRGPVTGGHHGRYRLVYASPARRVR
jgi:hypothetical protein